MSTASASFPRINRAPISRPELAPYRGPASCPQGRCLPARCKSPRAPEPLDHCMSTNETDVILWAGGEGLSKAQCVLRQLQNHVCDYGHEQEPHSCGEMSGERTQRRDDARNFVRTSKPTETPQESRTPMSPTCKTGAAKNFPKLSSSPSCLRGTEKKKEIL